MSDEHHKSGLSWLHSLLTRRNLLIFVIWVALCVILYETSTFDYQLFHIMAEAFSIVIACAIFFITWNTRFIVGNSYLTLIGIAFLFVGVIDFFHMLTYKGMGVFSVEDGNMATQLWIAARYLFSISLLVAPIFLNRKLKVYTTLFSYLVFTTLVLVSIMGLKIFPQALTETGLTPFKIASEYIVSGLLIIAMWRLYKNRERINSYVLRLIIGTILLSIASEMAFTLYTDVYGITNMTGHVLKILAFALVYKAIIETELRKPYETIFRELKSNEANLEQLNTQLTHEIEIRKTIEANLLAAELDLIRAQEVAKLGNWRYIRNTGEFVWSDLAYKIVGVPPGTKIDYGKIMELIHPDDREHVDNEWQAALLGEVYETEHRIITQQGTKWVKEIAELEYDDSGTLLGVFGTMQDITDSKKIEQMKDEFIGLVSHELRTPLTIIIGSLKSAMSEGISEEDKFEMIENATEGAESLSEILENMLELSRYQSGRLELNVKPVKMFDQVCSVVQKMSGQYTNREFVIDIPSGLPPVIADTVRVERILHNLIENAVKYSPSTTDITVSCHVEDNNLVTQVINHGEMISQKDINKLFELFQRLPHSSATGVGLGLVVCKRLVSAHGGWIRASSSKEATIFEFALPTVPLQPYLKFD